ncbi:MAG: pyridoxamine kinase [Clostridia bacterium]|nr:pyridoxamine kinase [Clostridia bacterium]
MINRYEDSPEFVENSELLERITRIAAVHDISCLGRCALTVIIPVLSAMGVQTVPLPTALLSTHTGGFENMFFEDLTRHMREITAHWKSIDADFDAIYSGFLGSAEQIDMLVEFRRDFAYKNDGKKTLIAVDPVMGDDGELYSTYDKALMLGMSRLCLGADLITPNLTEACFLTETKYPTHFMQDAEAEEFAGELLAELSKRFGCGKAVITGIDAMGDDGKKRIVTAALDSAAESKPVFFAVPHLDRAYPGTGDVFASVLLGKMLSGEDFSVSVADACDFVCRSTAFSQKYATPIRDGLIIEPCLKLLWN